MFKFLVSITFIFFASITSATQEELQESFNALCSLSELDCKSIEVRYNKLEKDREGQAFYYNTGRMEIQVAKRFEDRPRNTNRILTHEIAHLIVFSTEKHVKHVYHGKSFKKACNALRKLAGVAKDSCKE